VSYLMRLFIVVCLQAVGALIACMLIVHSDGKKISGLESQIKQLETDRSALVRAKSVLSMGVPSGSQTQMHCWMDSK